MQKKDDARNLVDTFMCDSVSSAEVSEEGAKLFVLMYSGQQGDTLHNLRYVQYMNYVATSNVVIRPEVLPPSERAAHFHSLRVYIQVMDWKHLKSTLHPQD